METLRDMIRLTSREVREFAESKGVGLLEAKRTLTRDYLYDELARAVSTEELKVVLTHLFDEGFFR